MTDKDITVRLPARLRRGKTSECRWVAELTLDDRPLGSLFSETADSQPEARAQLTALVTRTLRLLEDGPVLVIGGDGQYAQHLHLLHAQPGGWIVTSIRDGHIAGTWSSNNTRDEFLAQILAHVGGQPTVLRL